MVGLLAKGRAVSGPHPCRVLLACWMVPPPLGPPPRGVPSRTQMRGQMDEIAVALRSLAAQRAKSSLVRFRYTWRCS